MFKVSKTSSLVNVSNSILKAFGIPTFHDSYSVLDEIIEANKGKPICLVLFDGLGKTIIEEHKEAASFIYKNRLETITSVFPPTTVAATTSLTTGLYPCETGWLGWRQYFKDKNQIVDMFSSLDSGDETPLKPSTHERFPITTIMDLINAKCGENTAGHLPGHLLGHFDKYDTGLFFAKLSDTLKEGHKFIYAYWPEPDATLHMNGNNSEQTNKVIREISSGLENIVKDNPDVLFMSLADHGHIDIDYHSITEHHDLAATLVSPVFFIESRACGVRIKNGCNKEFEELFEKYYGAYYEMYSKEEVISKQLFGYSLNTVKGFEDQIGDYLLVAKSSFTLSCIYNHDDMISTHAGGTEREGLITLSVYNND